MTTKKKQQQEQDSTKDSPPTPRGLPPLWRKWDVVWQFYTPVYSSVPASPDVMRAWLESRAPDVRPPGGKSISEIQEEVVESLFRGEGNAPTESEVDAQMKLMMLVFQTLDVDGERVIGMRKETLRAHLKDCARVLSAQYFGRIQGERAFSTRVINGLYVDLRGGLYVPLLRPDGTTITKPDEETDRFVHSFRTNAIKRLQLINPETLFHFRLLTLGDSITEEDLETLMMYGGTHGYGGERSLSGGKYFATIARVEN